MRMLKLTRTIMGAENCAYNMKKRKESFAYAHLLLSGFNKIDPTMYMDEETVPMPYHIVIEEDECVQCFFRAKHFLGHWWSPRKTSNIGSRTM